MSDTHGTSVHDQHGPGQAAAGSHDGGNDDGHGGGHGHDDHDGAALGPIDWTMWGVGIVGVAAALIMTAGFVVATGFVLGA